VVFVIQHLSVGRHLVALEHEGGHREDNKDHANQLEDEHGDIKWPLALEYHGYDLGGSVKEGPKHEELPVEET
jgi:hypothetical protein